MKHAENAVFPRACLSILACAISSHSNIGTNFASYLSDDSKGRLDKESVVIALIGPTKLDFDCPVREPQSLIEIALLLNDDQSANSTSTDSSGEGDVQCLSEFECELVSNKLSELCAIGKVRKRIEGNWVVYEVTADICRMLLFLLLRHSSPHRRQAL